METADVRRRVRAAIESARKAAQERRARTDEAARAYEDFLTGRAVPVFQAVASALAGEGHRFKVFTPAGAVRLASESAADDYIEVFLDSASDPPAVTGRTSRGRGRRLLTSERPLKEDVPVASLTDEDVLSFVLTEIAPFVER